jgi:hypothetical protein
MKKTTVINLFAGPGVGKSTIAAGIFYELKCKGISCELSGEVAKDKVWENNTEALLDQPYIFGKQQHRIRRLYGKVDYIIADSPILLSIAYSHEDSKNFNDYIIEQHNKYKCINFYIERNLYKEGYEQIGRVQSLSESTQKDNDILEILHNYNISYEYVTGSNSKDIVNQILNIIDNKQKNGMF